MATILTTQFTREEYWIVGLSLFKATKRVITQLDELMHIQACIDLSHKFLGDDRQRKEVLTAVAIVSAGSSIIDSISKCRTIDDPKYPIDVPKSFEQERPIAQPPVNSTEELQSTLKDQCESNASDMEVEDHLKEKEKKEELKSILIQSRDSEPELELNDAMLELEPEFCEG